MLSELQGATRTTPALPQVHVPTPASIASGAALASVPAELNVRSVVDSSAQAPKVQAPKPIEIKVDLEKMRAGLQESLEKMNQVMRDGGRNLTFSMDEKVGGLVIFVKNADTGEVVRQIPSEAVVRMAHSMDAFKGILHNELS
jgi:flagellar protein FlaG